MMQPSVRSIRPRLFAVAALVLVTGAMGSGSSFGQVCESQAVGRGSYLCTVKSNFAPEPFSDCFYFVSPHSEVSSAFQLYIPGLGDDLVCNCGSAGTFGSPSFDSTNAFYCVTQEDGVNSTFTILGKTADGGKKLSKGQVFSDSGDLFVFSCMADTLTCGIALQAPREGPNPWVNPKR